MNANGFYGSGTIVHELAIDGGVAVEAVTRRLHRLPHLELIVKLAKLGDILECDVWVASDERGSRSSVILADRHCAQRLPSDRSLIESK